jgi:hypothetical protein
LVDLSAIDIEFEVIEAIEAPEGKWPNALGNVILIDG